MGQFFEYTTKISASQAGLCSQCRPSGMLEILQEAATLAGASLGLSGPEIREKYNALWMVTRIWYQLDKPLLWGESVMVKTWHRGGKGAMSYRDFDLYQDGRQVGQATSIWVMVDADSRKLLRMGDLDEFAGTDGGELCKEKKLTGLKLPAGLVEAGGREFHYSDTDSNGHVNNVRYADMAADALGLERLLPQGQFVSSLQIGYMKECLAGESIRLLTADSPEGRFVQGVDGQGVGRFDALLTLDKVPEGR